MKKNKFQKQFCITLASIFATSTLSAIDITAQSQEAIDNLQTKASESISEAAEQIPSFDYENMTANEVLNLSAEDLSTINEEAFEKIFGEVQKIDTAALVDQATDAINNLADNAITDAAGQIGDALNSYQTQAAELTQNISSQLDSISNMDLSNLSADSLGSLTDFGAQGLSMPTSLSLGGGGSVEKTAELISLQTNINQKIANQTVAKARLLILYPEDLLLHKKINFSQSKIVQIEKLK